MQDNFSVSSCTTFYTFFFVQPFQNLAIRTTKPQLIFAAIRGSGSNWLFEIKLTSALLDKGAVLKRNDCVNIYDFWSVRVWGWSWRSGSISFHGRAHSLPPHARTLFYILPTIHPRKPYLRRYTGLLLRGACAPPWFPFLLHESEKRRPYRVSSL